MKDLFDFNHIDPNIDKKTKEHYTRISKSHSKKRKM